MQEMAPRFSKFSGGACPRTPLANSLASLGRSLAALGRTPRIITLQSIFETWQACINYKHEGQDGRVSLTWLPDKFRVGWSFGSREEVQYRFSRWRLSWVSSQNNFRYFFLSTSHLDKWLPMKFRVNWPFCSEENVQNRFSTRLLGQPSWISNQNDFSYF